MAQINCYPQEVGPSLHNALNDSAQQRHIAGKSKPTDIPPEPEQRPARVEAQVLYHSQPSQANLLALDVPVNPEAQCQTWGCQHVAAAGGSVARGWLLGRRLMQAARTVGYSEIRQLRASHPLGSKIFVYIYHHLYSLRQLRYPVTNSPVLKHSVICVHQFFLAVNNTSSTFVLVISEKYTSRCPS